MVVATRLNSSGVLLTGGGLDEVTYTSSKVASDTLYASEFDEVTLNPITNGLAKRDTADGKILVAGYFDEYTLTTPQPVFDLDAANYSALPVNGSTVNGQTLIVSNAGSSLSWNSANGGVFRKGINNGGDIIAAAGLNFRTSNYTVFVAYKVTTTQTGRLLNTYTEVGGDWCAGTYTNVVNSYYPNGNVRLSGDAHDTNWHMNWFTGDYAGDKWSIYSGTSSGVTALVTNSTAGSVGFNGMRIFSRSGNGEITAGDVAFVKVYDYVLSAAEINVLYALNKTRFNW
jgi:hypothetical protein